MSTKMRYRERQSTFGSSASAERCGPRLRRIPVPAIRALLLVALASLPAAATAAQETGAQVSVDELAGRHRQWLTEAVVYIISPIERQAFLMLETDEQRDAFMEAFWRARDPSPGTVLNEAREEHERRIQYANRYLGSETPRRGWQTDRGRIYIQLGEPADKQSWADPRAFYPIELWFYRADPVLTGLPSFFYVMFFRPLQGGEFRMYDPITDGPGALAKDMMLQMADTREIVDRLLTGVGHEVAMASINLIPTEPTDLRRPRASARNSFLFGAIEQAPLKRIDDRYARAFLAGRGEVDAAVVFDTMPLRVLAMAFWDDRGLPYLHFGVEVPEDTALIGEAGDNYGLSLRFGYDIDDPRGHQILVDSSVIEERFDESRARQIAAAPFGYYDRVELVPGAYDLTTTLTNQLTKDESIAGTRLSVADTAAGNTVLSDLLVASATLPLPDGWQNAEPAAFQFGGEQFLPAAGGRLPAGGTAELFVQMVAGPDAAPGTTVEAIALLFDDAGNEVASTQGAPVAVVPSPAPTPLRLSLPLAGTSAGPHAVQLVARLSDGRSIAREAALELVPSQIFTPPELVLAAEERLEGIEEYRRRGWQHVRKGELRAAEAYVTIAVENEPDNVGLRRSLAGIEINLGEFDDAVAVIGPVARAANPAAIDLLIYSQALRGSGAAAEAAAVARQILARGATAPAYNALAEALVDLGNVAEAIEAYEASLVILPDQPAVREALEKLRNGGRASDLEAPGN